MALVSALVSRDSLVGHGVGDSKSVGLGVGFLGVGFLKSVGLGVGILVSALGSLESLVGLGVGD